MPGRSRCAAGLGIVAFVSSFIVPSLGPRQPPEPEPEESFEALVDAEESALPELNDFPRESAVHPEPT